jgi:hypothetical protein
MKWSSGYGLAGFRSTLEFLAFVSFWVRRLVLGTYLISVFVCPFLVLSSERHACLIGTNPLCIVSNERVYIRLVKKCCLAAAILPIEVYPFLASFSTSSFASTLRSGDGVMLYAM